MMSISAASLSTERGMSSIAASLGRYFWGSSSGVLMLSSFSRNLYVIDTSWYSLLLSSATDCRLRGIPSILHATYTDAATNESMLRPLMRSVVRALRYTYAAYSLAFDGRLSVVVILSSSVMAAFRLRVTVSSILLRLSHLC